MIAVVHCKRAHYDVYIGRPSKWGNPYAISSNRSREDVLALYEAYIMNSPRLLSELVELRGKTLGCWCSPLGCHGDILARLANTTTDEEVRS